MTAKTSKTLAWAGLLGILVYLLLPGFLKIFAFLIPAIALSYSFSKKFNWYILLTLSLLFILFPSSLFTMDVSSPFNITATEVYIKNIMQVLITIFVVIIPILALVGAIYAIYVGQVNEGITTIIKVIATIVIAAVVMFFGSMLGWNLLNLEIIKPVADMFWNVIKDILNFFTQSVPEFFGAKEEDYLSLKMGDDIELLSVIDSPKTLFLSVESVYPLFLSGFCHVIALIQYATKIDIKKIDNMDDEQRFNRPNTQDFSFLIFLIIVLIAAFMLYLSYSFEAFLNYQNLGFFGIYLSITIVSCIMLTLGIGSATKLSPDTVVGVVLGVALLFLYANMFTQMQTLNILGLEYQDLTSIKILNQFLFVAPTESLLFHVFLPSLVVFYYLRKNQVLSKEELDLKVNTLEIQINTKEDILRVYNLAQNTNEYARNIKEINKLKLKILTLKQSNSSVQSRKFSNRDFIFYLVYCLLFNVCFSILHWFKSGLTFEVFWSSGLGFLYLSSGFILTLISYRFGWLSGVLAHAIHNSTTLLLITLMAGI